MAFDSRQDDAANKVSKVLLRNPEGVNTSEQLDCNRCPVGGRCGRLKQFADYPVYKENYIRAFDRMIKAREEKGLPPAQYSNGRECFNWWMEETTLPGQMEFTLNGDGEMEFKEFR